MDEFKMTESQKEVSGRIFGLGCINDENSATEIASIILKSVYGKNFDNGLPLTVSFDDKSQEWHIKTQAPEDYESGAKYIIIKKSNAEIIGIWATK